MVHSWLRAKKAFGVELLGPVLPDTSWQAQADEGFDITHFQVDWKNQKVTCPEGQTNRYWRTGKDRHDHPVIRVYFPPKICNACPVVTKCTQSATGRSLSIKPQVEHEATQEARQRQELPEFKEKYHARAGIEGTLSQAVVALGMRKTRYRDPVKVHFQHLTTAAAINLKRVYAWLNETPRAETRTSAFAALAA